MEYRIMQVPTLAPGYRSIAQPRQTNSVSTTFGQQLDIAACRSADRADMSNAGATWQAAGKRQSSPYDALKDSYLEWRAQQPEQELPDSYGPSEENLACLKERYTGDLSWEERVDALNTMVKMGVITRGQMNETLGIWGTSVTYSFDEMMALTVKEQGRFDTYLSGGWDAYFAGNTISKFKTADDLFAWLDDLLAKEAENSETLAENAAISGISSVESEE